MLRFDKEERIKIAEVADLLDAIVNDEIVNKMRKENDALDCLIDTAEDTVSDLNTLMECYDDYLRDEAVKTYVNTYGFNKN